MIDTSLVHPRYGVGSLSDILPSVVSTLRSSPHPANRHEPGTPAGPPPPGAQPDRLGLADVLTGVRVVVVLLVDGLGHHLLPVAAPHAPTLADLATGRLGAARTLTAGFPSTTPTSLVSLGTGAPPGAHGVLGFTLRVPGTGRLLNHIFWSDDPQPRVWQPLQTQFESAAAAGIEVALVGRPEFAGTGLSVAAYGPARYRGAGDTGEMADQIIALAGSASRPALIYAYHPDLDRFGHLCGVDSAIWRQAAADLDTMLSRLLDGLPGDAALLLTADHGQLDIPAEKRFDVDTDPRLAAGVDVVAGEARVRYLHTRPGARADVIDTWRAVLRDAAWVVSREQAVADGWFGPVPEEHLARVGDVVVACLDRYAVLATVREPAVVAQFVAYHGSATAVEMEIPLLIARGAGGNVRGGG